MDRLADCLDIGGETELASGVTVRVPAWPMRLGLPLRSQMPLLPCHSCYSTWREEVTSFAAIPLHSYLYNSYCVPWIIIICVYSHLPQLILNSPGQSACLMRFILNPQYGLVNCLIYVTVVILLDRYMWHMFHSSSRPQTELTLKALVSETSPVECRLSPIGWFIINQFLISFLLLIG